MSPSKFKPVAVVIEGFRIEDVITNDFKNKIGAIYGEKYEIRFANLDIVLLPKEGIKKVNNKINNKKLEIKLQIRQPPRLSLRHRGEKDYIDRRIVVSSDENVLEAFLDNLDTIIGGVKDEAP